MVGARIPDEDSGCLAEDELLRFVDGAVSRGRAADIRAHVDTCDGCRELLAIAGRDARMADGEASDGEIAIGTELDGRFRIEREIGHGGMGVVYAAIDVATSRRVALKVLNQRVAGRAESIHRFGREARVAASLVSPHVARILDVGRLSSGAQYMAMELLEGEDLERLLARRGPLPVPLALECIMQACLGLAEAHAAGIVHRDIKLPNLFLAASTPTAIVKVLDFGLAKHPSIAGADGSLTHADTLLGTLHYMSPEQLFSARDVDARTDLWALGVCLYRLLSGRFPFHSENPVRLCALVLETRPPPLEELRPDVPPDVAAIVARCLSRSPRDRIGSARELADALSGALTKRATAEVAYAGTPPVPSLPPRSSRRRPGAGVMALSFAVVAALAVALLVADGRSARSTLSTTPSFPPPPPLPPTEAPEVPTEIPAATPSIVDLPPVSAETASPVPSSTVLLFDERPRAPSPALRRPTSGRPAAPRPTSGRPASPRPASSADKLYEKM